MFRSNLSLAVVLGYWRHSPLALFRTLLSSVPGFVLAMLFLVLSRGRHSGFSPSIIESSKLPRGRRLFFSCSSRVAHRTVTRLIVSVNVDAVERVLRARFTTDLAEELLVRDE